jgi:hypothetical protein
MVRQTVAITDESREGWVVASLFDVCNPQQWPTIATKLLLQQGYPVFGANGQIGFYSQYNHEKPTVLMTCRGATCGTLNICKPFSYVTGNAMCLDDLEEAVCDLRFLFYALKYRGLEDAISGSAQPQITRRNLEIVDFPLAPIKEQERIVAALDGYMVSVRGISDHLSKVHAILKRFRQAVLAAACSGRLTEDWREEQSEVEPATLTLERIRHERSTGKQVNTVAPVDSDELPKLPESWVWARFGVLLGELRNGISTKPELSPPGVSILRISSVRSGSVLLNEHRFLLHGADMLPDYGLRDGDLLFTRYNGSLDLLGVCGMVRGLGSASMLYPDKLMRVRFDHDHVLPAYAELDADIAMV